MLYIYIYITKLDFYHIGAMKVFSQLGQLIEEDERLPSQAPASERNQIKLSDLKGWLSFSC